MPICRETFEVNMEPEPPFLVLQVVPDAHLVGSADFLHPLPWMAVAVGASDADVEE